MRHFFIFCKIWLSVHFLFFAIHNRLFIFLKNFELSCFFGHSQLSRSLLVVLVKFPLGTFSDTLIRNARFWNFNIIGKFIAVFLTFWYFSVLSLRRRCIDVLTFIAGYAKRCAHLYKRLFSKHWVRAGLRDPYRTEWCFHVVQHVCFFGFYMFFASRRNGVPIFAIHTYIPIWCTGLICTPR